MTAERATFLIENDSDYDDDGLLKQAVKQDYEDDLEENELDELDNDSQDGPTTLPLDVAILEEENDDE